MFLLPYALVLLLYGGATVLIRRRGGPAKPGHWIGVDDADVPILEATQPKKKDDRSSSGSLARARDLQAPEVTSTTGGEMDHLEFWNVNSQLIQDAWHEWERDFSMYENEQPDVGIRASSFSPLPPLNETTMMEYSKIVPT